MPELFPKFPRSHAIKTFCSPQMYSKVAFQKIPTLSFTSATKNSKTPITHIQVHCLLSDAHFSECGKNEKEKINFDSSAKPN